ncbi:MAG: restriction endonuclease [Anaerolineae bacterium]|nr:restriction endonuclease [Anaerolineae bacterium]
MPNPVTENTLFYGDNLAVLREHIPGESVDLIYLDPPFNSNRNYNILFKDESGFDSEAQITAFEDTWHWGRTAAQTYDELITQAPDRVARVVDALRAMVGFNQMMAYLVMMAARLIELYRVLKPTGSLYLHCDPSASHYLKIVLDAIFGNGGFVNEIIWQRTAVKGDVRRKYGAVHDVLLFYAKGENYRFESQYVEANESYRARFKYDDNDGRGPYQSAPLDSPNPRPNLTYSYKGYDPPAKGWRVSREVMEQLDAEGRLIFPETKQGRIRRKVYLNEQDGPKAVDVWTDIPPLQATSAERLGYPTQKPLALLERIIEASTDPGDWVLDPFCGCGTAIVAAQQFGRRWIGIDVTHLSVALQKYRLEDMFGLKPKSDYAVVGEPTDAAGARQLAQENRFQFEWWALSLVRAQPSGGVAGSRKGKKGSDKGIDGIIPFKEGPKRERALVQVKSGRVSVRDIRDLGGTVERENAALGVLITLEKPTGHMEREANAAGFYTSPSWGRAYPRIQILTIEELLAGAHVEMPPAHGTFKQAPRAEMNNAEQPPLGL